MENRLKEGGRIVEKDFFRLEFSIFWEKNGKFGFPQFSPQLFSTGFFDKIGESREKQALGTSFSTKVAHILLHRKIFLHDKDIFIFYQHQFDKISAVFSHSFPQLLETLWKTVDILWK